MRTELPAPSGASGATSPHSAATRALLATVFDDLEVPAELYRADTLELANANQLAIADFQARGLDPEGATLGSLLPERIAEERLPLIKKAIDRGEPLRILGMVNGVLLRSVYRPLPAESGPDHLLATRSPINEGASLFRLQQERQTEQVHAQPDFRARADDLGPLSMLTEREIEVLRLIGLGLSTEEAAARLHRSAKTVQGHRLSLGLKLNVSNRVELARIAIRAGLTHLDGDAVVLLWRQAKLFD